MLSKVQWISSLSQSGMVLIFNKKLKMKYKNIPLPEFPSKYVLLNKQNSRREAFDQILKLSINFAIQNK